MPLTQPVGAEITVPGSKSITNRALILAALADGTVTLTGALWSEDTQIMVECLEKLGFDLRVENDPEEFCNRTITVKGLGGKIPKGGTAEKPLELFVGNAGTAARFLSAFVCLGDGVYRLAGIPRMNERPKAALFQALRELGYRVESEKKNEKLPVTIFGRSRGNETQTKTPKDSQSLLTSSPTGKKCKVDISESSQFASALLLCAKHGGWKIEVTGENADESPYVAMTTKLIEAFPNQGGKFQIEPDASSGSYFIAASKLAPRKNRPDEKTRLDTAQRLAALALKSSKTANLGWRQDVGNSARFWREMLALAETDDKILAAAIKDIIANNSLIGIRDWPKSTWQIDAAFPKYVFPEKELGELFSVSRENNLADSIMTAVVIAPLDHHISKFTDLGRLRLQECERVVALRTELTKCGAKVEEQGDTLTVYPSQLHGAEIETYNDHRMAMCFAILGLKVPDIKIKNPACVKKTFPNFFQKLATPPPKGLGVTILDGSGKKLRTEDLFAD
ncbi:MAG TPA: 3-phosphoshikimate 1-carboxyvinyltransferase [Desulfuromonadaceae bacterium]|nr:3-phosphoshikimate 1-carboxyvinyltransferase [Desulfuromonadaceae bacterium]